MRVRQANGNADLRSMQALTRRIWPAAAQHVGDLAWAWALGAPADRSILLWEDHERVLAWLWTDAPDDIRLEVDPDRPDLLDRVLDRADAAELHPLAGQRDLRDALVRRGYRPEPDTAHFCRHARPLGDLPAVVLPAGFVARGMRGELDSERRVAVHREAWSSTRFTAAAYRILSGTWPYRPELDVVVVEPGGRFVASCLIWLDDVHGVGLIEPVGTVPQFRRRGLARAVCLAALHALRDAGATAAVVAPRGDGGYPVPQRMYRAMGFRPVDRTIAHRR